MSDLSGSIARGTVEPKNIAKGTVEPGHITKSTVEPRNIAKGTQWNQGLSAFDKVTAGTTATSYNKPQSINAMRDPILTSKL